MVSSVLLYLFLGRLLASTLAEPAKPHVGEYLPPQYQRLHQSQTDRGHDAKTIRVYAGHSIQRAIDAAPEGAHIIVQSEVYHEQVTIDKNGVNLAGEDAVIIPPHKPRRNPCTGFAGPRTKAGICVVGDGINAAKFEVEHRKVLSVKHPVRHAEVSGFRVKGFTGANILVLGAAETTIHDNHLSDGPNYGLLTAGSRDIILFRNWAGSSKGGFAAICIDDLSGTEVIRNTVGGYFLGIFIQTDGAVVENNEITSACFGVFVDPTIRDVHVCNNKVRVTISKCGVFGGAGIILDSSVRARVEGNLVRGQKTDDPTTEPRSGIAVVDDYCVEKSLACVLLGKNRAVSEGSVVKGNVLNGNQVDIYVNTTGKGNVVRNKECMISLPGGFC